MGSAQRMTIISVILATLLVACGPAVGPDTQAARDGGNPPAAKKRVVAAWVITDVGSVSALPVGSEGKEIASFVHAGLGMFDDQQVLHPQLAEAVPTLENGLWRLFPDGRMETIWKLKPNARWHDGVEVTMADLTFGAEIAQDKDLGMRSSLAPWNDVESIDATDSLSVTIRWKRPHIEADVWFASSDQLLPKHLLAQAYTEDRGRFATHSYWTDGFIGAGPFKLKEYVRGSHILFERFDDYVLGRPRLDEVEVRFIGDASAMMAQVLAGEVDTNIDASMAPDQAAQLRERWRDGRVVTSQFTTGNVAIFPQMLDPALPLVLNAQFRRALLHAMDRQEMVDTIMLGGGGISHSIVSQAMSEHDFVQDATARYEYDPRKAAQMLEGIGLRKGGDGLYLDPSGGRLSFDIRALESDPQERVRATLVVADYWRRLGLDVTPFMVPPHQASDRQYVSEFPTFFLSACTSTYDRVVNCFHSSQARTAQTRFNGPNRSRYMNPELDALLERFITTVPLRERVQPLREAIRIETEEAVWMGLFRGAYNTLMSNRLQNRQLDTYRSDASFAHLWDVTR